MPSFGAGQSSLPYLGLSRRIWADFGPDFRARAAGGRRAGETAGVKCPSAETQLPAVRAVSGDGRGRSKNKNFLIRGFSRHKTHESQENSGRSYEKKEVSKHGYREREICPLDHTGG